VHPNDKQEKEENGRCLQNSVEEISGQD